jgi:hypothetical protein
MSFILPDADTLVDYLKDWTGSTNDTEIKQAIFQAELAMRNIELPANRTDPYDTFGIVGANNLMPIPPDMNKPILFFQQGTDGEETSTGPWIVYDRIGDRDIITQGLVAQLYLSPVNVPAVIRGRFSEVGSNYQLLPYCEAGTVINMYYYKAWDLLFTPIYNDVGTVIGTVQTNPVLQSWPEGYVYGSLHEYYVKRHNAEDAGIYKAKFDSAWGTVNNQNNLGKWSGGHTRMTSIFQPRRDRSYAIK